MYYKREETYTFSCPREFKAYLAFKEELRQANVPFHDMGGVNDAVIKVIVYGNFDVNENGGIRDLVS